MTAFVGSLLEKVKEQNIENFLFHLQKTENISSAYQKQFLNAIGKYYELFYSRKLDFKYLYLKRKQKTLNSFKLFGFKRKLDVFGCVEGFFEFHSRATEG